jgi:hypothetical protein
MDKKQYKYPDRASPEQFGKLAERLERDRQMTGSDGRYDKPKPKKPAPKKEISKKVSDILKTIKPIDIDNFKTYKSSLPRATIPMPDLTKRRDPDMEKGLGSLPRKFPIKPTLI